MMGYTSDCGHARHDSNLRKSGTRPVLEMKSLQTDSNLLFYQQLTIGVFFVFYEKFCILAKATAMIKYAVNSAFALSCLSFLTSLP